MRIKKIELKNFKRFTDLTISEIPESAKLVLLIGSNGSGKSCLFESFDWLSKGQLKAFPNYGANTVKEYYRKFELQEMIVYVQFHNEAYIGKKDTNIYNESEVNLANKFIGRSSIRIVPRITNKANPQNISSDSDSPVSYIENDTRFINDIFQYIQNINNSIREPVFQGKQVDVLKIFQESIEPLNKSLINIFEGDESTTIQIAEFQDATPNEAAKLIFKKGSSKINYDLLSHGEKQVVILLINFIVRQEYYKDGIIFIDEMDCHLNTSLQSNLLKEIVDRWIPDDSQLWTASHALGFIDYAQNSDNACIIDFDLLNFDYKQEIIPTSKEKVEVYDVAIPKATIANILKNYRLVVVENKNDEYYNAALGDKGYLFLPANNNREVFLTVKNDKDKIGLRDRDYLRNDELRQIIVKFPNLKILPFYTFENLIYHPENIAEIGVEGYDIQDYIAEIIRQKNEKLISVVSEIGVARSHYVEFKEGVKNDGNIKEITTALQSDDFQIFYPYFNMKNHFNKLYLSKYNLSVLHLTSTNWFKNIIIDTLN